MPESGQGDEHIMAASRLRSGRGVSRIALAGMAIIAATATAVTVAGASSGLTKLTSTTTDPGLALQADFIKVVNAVRPSVVEIATTSGLGSGVVYDNKGDIVTNAHVVGNSKTFTVSFSNGKHLSGRLLGTFAPDDLAVIRVSPATGLKAARFGNSATLQVGEIVLAMGSPLGLASSVTDGIVSFNGRVLDEGNGVVLAGLVQTSAAINPGNSGGALVSLSTQVIGIPTLGATSGTGAAAGLGFAIPANTVKLIAPQLIAHGKVTTAGRASLGISGADGVSFSGTPVGVVVSEVQPSGPAAIAGIVVGELISAINGVATPTYSALETVLAGLNPRARVSLTVTSATGRERKVSVILADLAQG